MTDRQIKDVLRGARFLDSETNHAQNTTSLRFEKDNSTYELKITIDEGYPPTLEFAIRQRR